MTWGKLWKMDCLACGRGAAEGAAGEGGEQLLAAPGGAAHLVLLEGGSGARSRVRLPRLERRGLVEQLEEGHAAVMGEGAR